MTNTGIVFHIQRFSIHDGPGIRTTVFFKGCPLRCFWCHNPEGLRTAKEIQFSPNECIACGECVAVCPEHAQALVTGEDGQAARSYQRDRCRNCGSCVDTCFSGGLKVVGTELSAQQVIDEVLQDKAFYQDPAGGAPTGGVTLSGGEPLLQPDFAAAILKGCRDHGIHTAIETTTCCSWGTLERLLPLTDLFMVDIKHVDPIKHRAATGVSNAPLLDHIRKIVAAQKQIIFRVPVIPGFNDTPDEIIAIVRTVCKMFAAAGRGSERPALDLLTFHQLAADKYQSLGMAYYAADLKPPGADHMAMLRTAAENSARGKIDVRVR